MHAVSVMHPRIVRLAVRVQHGQDGVSHHLLPIFVDITSPKGGHHRREVLAAGLKAGSGHATGSAGSWGRRRDATHAQPWAQRRHEPVGLQGQTAWHQQLEEELGCTEFQSIRHSIGTVASRVLG